MAAVAVAVSGGRDSMALLHATAVQARGCNLAVHAFHVHHGLQADADAWVDAIAAACSAWSATLHVERLQTHPARGESVEAWARRERYRALATLARDAGVTLLLLAHHRRDQAETFLLQALRGAGAAGLSAMPNEAEREGVTWARPWLDHAREAIEAYVQQYDVPHIEDASNGDARYARNRLRLRVMPALREAFPEAEAALAESAARSAESRALLDEVAAVDLPAVASASALQVAPWSGLSPARRRNALRAWLRERLGQGPSQSLIDRLMLELAQRGSARWPAGNGELRRYRGRLTWTGQTAEAPTPPPLPTQLSIHMAGDYALLEWRGALKVEAVDSGGVALARLQSCQLRSRAGGERFQQRPGGTARSLKKQFQSAAIPAWQRDAPLLFDEAGQLVFVPGLGLDARVWAAPGELQVRLAWEPSGASAAEAAGPDS